MKKASAASLDLVQLANDSDHPVCKLMDYGKHLFDKKKQKSASKKKQKRTQVKEIKFRRREMAHQNLGLELLKRIETDLSDQAVVEQEPQSEGRQLVMVMSPAKKKN